MTMPNHDSSEPDVRVVGAVNPLGAGSLSFASLGPLRTFMRISSALTLAALVTIAGCSRAPVITITNQSTNALTNFIVSGSGFSERIGLITAGAERTLTIRPRGESGLRIAFDAGSQHIDVDDLAYVEPRSGYRVSITIQPDLKIVASEHVEGY